MYCRHTHLQQQLLKESIQPLPPPDPPAGAVGGLTASSGSSSMTTDECDSGLLQSATGVTHVGLLRAGAARHVIAALTDGQVLMYRENGEKACKCDCICVVNGHELPPVCWSEKVKERSWYCLCIGAQFRLRDHA